MSDVRDYLEIVYRDTTGRAHMAVGIDPSRTSFGKPPSGCYWDFQFRGLAGKWGNGKLANWEKGHGVMTCAPRAVHATVCKPILRSARKDLGDASGGDGTGGRFVGGKMLHHVLENALAPAIPQHVEHVHAPAAEGAGLLDEKAGEQARV